MTENGNDFAVTETKDEITTDFGYSIVAGWLILPAIGVLLSFLLTAITIITSSPTHAISLELYYFSIILSILYVPFYLVIIISWVKRKNFLPKLMIAYYSTTILFPILIFLYIYIFEAGLGNVQINLSKMLAETIILTLINLLWLLYFVKSKRVKATFTR